MAPSSLAQPARSLREKPVRVPRRALPERRRRRGTRTAQFRTHHRLQKTEKARHADQSPQRLFCVASLRPGKEAARRSGAVGPSTQRQVTGVMQFPNCRSRIHTLFLRGARTITGLLFGIMIHGLLVGCQTKRCPGGNPSVLGGYPAEAEEARREQQINAKAQRRKEVNEKDPVLACRGMGILPMIPPRAGRPCHVGEGFF